VKGALFELFGERTPTRRAETSGRGQGGLPRSTRGGEMGNVFQTGQCLKGGGGDSVESMFVSFGGLNV
jgi:hypothetical protein